jgi:hypothetical protein
MRYGTFSATALVTAIALAGPAAAVDVTSCGQTLDAGEIGVLQADLDCPVVFSPASFGVVLAHGARLELNGHVLGGAFHAVLAHDGNSRIVGPGEITGSYSAGISMSLGRLFVDDVDIHHNGAGIVLSDSSLIIHGGAVRDNDAFGVDIASTSTSRGGILAVGVDASGNGGYGLNGVKVKARDVDASDNGADGLRGDQVKAKNVLADGNGGFGIVANRVSASAVSASANVEVGIIASRIRGRQVDASGNGGYGVTGEQIRLKDATLLGNDGYGTAVDLRSVYPPRVIGVECGLSADYLGAPWGVCSGDAP